MNWEHQKLASTSYYIKPPICNTITYLQLKNIIKEIKENTNPTSKSSRTKYKANDKGPQDHVDETLPLTSQVQFLLKTLREKDP